MVDGVYELVVWRAGTTTPDVTGFPSRREALEAFGAAQRARATNGRAPAFGREPMRIEVVAPDGTVVIAGQLSW